MQLSDAEITRLLNQEFITDEWPWNTRDSVVIEKNIKDIVAEVRRKARVQDKTEFGHYGSGYASFVDCWLYRPDDEYRCGPGNHYYGLVVIFSRLSRYFVVGEGTKWWDGTDGTSYLPGFLIVDSIQHPAILELEQLVVPILESKQLCRLHTEDLAIPLPRAMRVPTILEDGAYRHFDALFHWED
jgi:hypothetical protein